MAGYNHVARWGIFAAVFVIGAVEPSQAQENRIFLCTPETIATWEFNDLGVGFLEALPNGTVIPDLSGNGLDATVEANESGSIAAGDADLNFDDNTSVAKVGGTSQARVVVNDDNNAFEFGPDDDFSIELYVYRDEQPGTQNWGILAGTWHSRTLLDDTLDPVADGAWYGYGFIRHNEGGGWAWNCSPINPDGTFTPSFNERNTARFEIPEGSHYVVASVDRELDMVTVYLDGEVTGTVNIPDGSAFIKPTGFEHARFMFLTGEDDSTRNAYRQAPIGYAIDAARVQARTIEPDEVFDNWLNIQDGAGIPVDEACAGAVLTASARDLLVGQCVLLSGVNSTAPPGEDIAKYEWKIGDGALEEGDATREISLDAPTDDAGIDVTLRITSSGGTTSDASVTLRVTHPAPVAEIVATRGGIVASGAVVLGTGETLELDGTGSSSPIPANAFTCPITDGNSVPAPGIGEYRWDLDSDGTIDSTEPSLETPPFNTAGDITVTLTVVNDAGGEASATLAVTVIDVPDVAPAPPGRIFLPTPETVGIWEFNEFDFDIDEPLPTGTIIPDESGNGLDATVEENDGGAVVVGEGDLNFDDNTAVFKVAASGATRIVINDDDNAFEMDELQDFSIELYVNRAEVVGGQNWGILAGTWHSRTLLDDGLDPTADGAWYGYGLIRNNDSAGWLWNFSPISPDGTFNPSFNELGTPAFDIPPGSHYVVVSVDRHEGFTPDKATAYLDGVRVGERTLPKGMAFIKPTDYEHARFMFFTGEDDATRGAYRQAPSGYAIDAARVMYKALSAEEVRRNHELIQLGIAVPPSESTATPFHRGDPNGDGTINITDAVAILNFLFGSGDEPQCAETADINNDGSVNITDPVGLLNFLFGGGDASPPAPPGPTSEPCGIDPDDPGSPGDLGCDSYVSC